MPNKIEDTILKLEKAALDRWGKGDPSGYLEICTSEVTYFDPFIDRRITGLNALTRYYDGLRGKIHIDRYEFIEPMVAAHGEIAVLTFNLFCQSGSAQFRWNCTEVYRNSGGQWRIIQSHWSLVKAC